MKKRILLMILMVTMIISVFTGCGAGGSADSNVSTEKITVSEMLANVLEENEGEVVIFEHESDAYKENFSEKTSWTSYSYDGENLYVLKAANDDTKTTINDLSSVDKSQKRNSSKSHSGKASLAVDTSRTDSPVEMLNMSTHPSAPIFFGECKHVEINGESYMFFTAYRIDEKDNAFRETMFTLIKDTDFTKGKLVVVDSTDEVEIETTTSYQYVSKLTDEDKEVLEGIND